MKLNLPTLYHPLDEVLHAGNHLHNGSWFWLGHCHVFKKYFQEFRFNLIWFETSIGSTGERSWYDDWEKNEKASTHPSFGHIQQISHQELVRQMFCHIKLCFVTSLFCHIKDTWNKVGKALHQQRSSFHRAGDVSCLVRLNNLTL